MATGSKDPTDVPYISTEGVSFSMPLERLKGSFLAKFPEGADFRIIPYEEIPFVPTTFNLFILWCIYTDAPMTTIGTGFTSFFFCSIFMQQIPYCRGTPQYDMYLIDHFLKLVDYTPPPEIAFADGKLVIPEGIDPKEYFSRMTIPASSHGKFVTVKGQRVFLNCIPKSSGELHDTIIIFDCDGKFSSIPLGILRRLSPSSVLLQHVESVVQEHQISELYGSDWNPHDFYLVVKPPIYINASLIQAIVQMVFGVGNKTCSFTCLELAKIMGEYGSMSAYLKALGAQDIIVSLSLLLQPIEGLSAYKIWLSNNKIPANPLPIYHPQIDPRGWQFTIFVTTDHRLVAIDQKLLVRYPDSFLTQMWRSGPIIDTIFSGFTYEDMLKAKHFYQYEYWHHSSDENELRELSYKFNLPLIPKPAISEEELVYQQQILKENFAALG